MTDKLKLFDFLDSINSTKEDLFEKHDDANGVYDPYVINMALSMNVDTVLYANEMNQYSKLSKEMQYKFYLNAISKKKRYGKWPKKVNDSETLNIVMEYYNFSMNKAEEALRILTDAQINSIKEKLKKGGRDDY